MKKIYIFKTSNGTVPFLSFMGSLDEKARKKLEYTLKSIALHQSRLSEPTIKHYSIERYRNLYELREKSRVLLRTIFTFDRNDDIILLYPFIKRHKRDTNYALESSLEMLEEISKRPCALIEYPFQI